MSAPLAKLLLPRADPWVLAGLLYVGAGGGLALFRVAQTMTVRDVVAHERLRREDAPMLMAIAVIGGSVGPVLMLTGLQRVSGVAGSLLLNLEAVFTLVLAVTLFGEQLTPREAVAAAVLLAGAALVSLRGGPIRAEQWGALAVAAACLAWGIDNNLTARLSTRNAVDIVQFKTLTAGAGNLVLALAMGRPLPGLTIVAVALAVGFVSYGLSIVLDVYALRYVGAARESAYFATAPFAGAIAAVPLLGEPLTRADLGGGAIMAAGVALLMAARMHGRGRSLP